MNSYNPLPTSKLFPSSLATKKQLPQKRNKVELLEFKDIRRSKIQEFLNSSNLTPNTRKVYERELRRVLS